ncbi:type IV pilus modification PilV family protein [Deinococcus kurensis]|uniref:type IV pilus modification PilV family protein n=1 Tax=Deinococcus kurensis TaxID=2662757 RepID=UPI0012D367CC|nr:type II secretion system protein [Deinococcus kurensis]
MRDDGFTLIEALVTISVIAIALMSILTLMSGTFNLNQRADSQSQATQLAQLQFDALKRVTPTTMPKNGQEEEDVTFNGREFRVRRSYCATVAYCTSDQRSVQLDVFQGKTLLFTGETVFTELRVK